MLESNQLILERLQESVAFISEAMTRHHINNVFYYVSTQANYIQSFALKGINIIFNPHETASIANILGFKRELTRHFIQKHIDTELMTFHELELMHVQQRMGRDEEGNEKNYNHVLKNMIDIESFSKSAGSSQDKLFTPSAPTN